MALLTLITPLILKDDEGKWNSGGNGINHTGGRGLTTEPAQGKISARLLFNDVVQNRLTSFAFTWVPAVRRLSASTGMYNHKIIQQTLEVRTQLYYYMYM